jgi:D-sedoheptulose 7-phosphate isomerase
MEQVDSYFSEISKIIQILPVTEINKMVSLLHKARINNKQVFVMGNGGSAATATHFVCDLIKNTRLPGCPDFRVIGLADNMATFSAYGNDEGYETVFAKQLDSLANAGDVVIGISTSGKSPNVLEAMKVAAKKHLVTIGLTGNDGGILGNMVQLNVHVPNWRPDQTEDVHLIVLHSVTAILLEQAKLLIIDKNEKSPVQQFDYQFLTGSNGNGSNGYTSNGNGNGNGIHRFNGNGANHSGNSAMDPILQTLERIDQEENSLIESPELLGTLLLHITQSLQASSGSFALLDENMQLANAALVYSGHVSNANLDQMGEFIQSGLAGWAVKNRQPALLPTTRKDRRWREHMQSGMLKSARSVLCVPLIVEESVVGVITLSRPEADPFTGKEMLFLTGIIAALTSRLMVKQV